MEPEIPTNPPRLTKLNPRAFASILTACQNSLASHSKPEDIFYAPSTGQLIPKSKLPEHSENTQQSASMGSTTETSPSLRRWNSRLTKLVCGDKVMIACGSGRRIVQICQDISNSRWIGKAANSISPHSKRKAVIFSAEDILEIVQQKKVRGTDSKPQE